MEDHDLYTKCLKSANFMIESNYPVGNISLNDLAKTLYDLEIEKIEKNNLSDLKINYNDEIINIEEVGELETVDISVSGDNLFYCNGILTKNSFGLPATVDLMFALISTEELENLNQIMVKQLKNRYNDVATYKRFVVGIDRTKMRLYNVEYSAQNDVLNDDRPVFDKSDFGEEIQNRKSKFNKKAYEDFI